MRTNLVAFGDCLPGSKDATNCRKLIKKQKSTNRHLRKGNDFLLRISPWRGRDFFGFDRTKIKDYYILLRLNCLHMLPDTYSPAEKEEIERRHSLLIEAWQTRKETQDLEMVDKAFYFAANAHKDQRRRSGEPYIYHPIEVATIAAQEIGLGRTSIVCALLHDVVEDTEYTLDDISEMFGEKVARVVNGLTKLNQSEETESIQAENFKKIISSLSYDIRVVLIKLADRLHNMRTLDSMPPHKQLKIASETSYLYAPLAYRLGLHAIKSELEDLALKYIDPAVFNSIKTRMDEVRESRIAELQAFARPIEEDLAKLGIKTEVKIIERSINSVYKRMRKKELPFEELYGNFLIRFVADCPIETEKIECWKIYAVLTSHYRPYTSMLKDWISLPKVNGYEAIHAVVMGKNGTWVDVQIRSQRMEEFAEKGFAAYWKYKTDEHTESGFDEWLKKAQDLIGSESDNAIEFVDSFKQDLFSKEIYVFTPKGKMVSLPKGATVLDFAYYIHSKIGDHCIAANVNNKLAQLTQTLRTGDQVQIITSESQHPQEKWFEYLVTAFAKSKLRSGIKEYRKRFREEGELLFNQIMAKIGLEPTKANRLKIMESEQISSAVDFNYFVATGKINEQSIRELLKPQSSSGNFFTSFLNGILGSNSKSKETSSSIHTSGEFDFQVADCCKPIPGDDVVAFNFPGEPLHIHRSNCPKAIEMSSRYGSNIVKAKWQPKSEIAFLAALQFKAVDNAGLLNQLTSLFYEEMRLNLHSLHMESKGDLVEAAISLYVHNKKDLDTLIDKMKKIKGIQKVTRIVNA